MTSRLPFFLHVVLGYFLSTGTLTVCPGGQHMVYVLIIKRILELALLTHLCGPLMMQAGVMVAMTQTN